MISRVAGGPKHAERFAKRRIEPRPLLDPAHGRSRGAPVDRVPGRGGGPTFARAIPCAPTPSFPSTWPFSSGAHFGSGTSGSAPSSPCARQWRGKRGRPVAGLLGETAVALPLGGVDAGAVAGAKELLAPLLVGIRGRMTRALALRAVLTGGSLGNRGLAGAAQLGELLTGRGTGREGERDDEAEDRQVGPEHGAQPTRPSRREQLAGCLRLARARGIVSTTEIGVFVAQPYQPA